MSKMVWDLEKGVVELVETQIYRIIKEFCFARLPSGGSVFCHFYRLSPMDAFNYEGMEYLPRFFRKVGNPPLRHPREGDRIVLLVRQEEKGPAAKKWSYVEEYEQALQRGPEYRKLKEECFLCDPTFRCQQIEQIAGSADRTRTIFMGRRKEFIERCPFGDYNTFDRPDPLLSRAIGDAGYIRWFERETASGKWERCEDPRTIKLPVSFSRARILPIETELLKDDLLDPGEGGEWFSEE